MGANSVKAFTCQRRAKWKSNKLLKCVEIIYAPPRTGEDMIQTTNVKLLTVAKAIVVRKSVLL
jgi:hypothetical protein